MRACAPLGFARAAEWLAPSARATVASGAKADRKVTGVAALFSTQPGHYLRSVIRPAVHVGKGSVVREASALLVKLKSNPLALSEAAKERVGRGRAPGT